MPAQDPRVDAKGLAHDPHLVLEQRVEGFDNLQFHFLWKASHIMVRFNRRRRTLNRYRLDDVGIDRALTQPFYIPDLVRLFVKHFDKSPSNGLALGFRLRKAP